MALGAFHCKQPTVTPQTKTPLFQRMLMNRQRHDAGAVHYKKQVNSPRILPDLWTQITESWKLV